MTRRDRYGRYLVVGPDGIQRPYTRATTVAGTLDAKDALIPWKATMTVTGMMRRPGLRARWEAICSANPQKGPWYGTPEAKKEAKALVEECSQAGGSQDRAEIGTALHELTHHLDLGDEVTVSDQATRADLDAYVSKRDELGITYDPAGIEAMVVLDWVEIAGTADRLITHVPGRDLPVVADLKGLALGTPIPTVTGWTTMGAIVVGDEVFGRDGHPCRVTAKSSTRWTDCYRIDFDDASTLIADGEHRWLVDVGFSGRSVERVMTTAEIAEHLPGGGQRHIRITNASPLALPVANLPIDPYVLGVWLGDGNRGRGEITKPADHGIWGEIERRGYQLGKLQIDSRTGCATRSVLGLVGDLRSLHVLNNKHVPEVYFRGSTEQRLDLLRGLMDSDGSWNKPRKQAQFCSTDKTLALSVYELAASLGWRPHLAEVEREGFGLRVTSYDVTFTFFDYMPFIAKADRVTRTGGTAKSRRRLVTSVRRVPTVPTQCIAVDSPDHTYLCGEGMIPTHNTGADLHFSWGSIAQQLAIYAHAQAIYDDGTRTDVPRLNLNRALVIHLPAGEARCDVWWVDIAAGWEAALTALKVREWRAGSRNGGLRLAPLEATTASQGSLSVREDLQRRIDRIRAHGGGLDVLRRLWPHDMPTLKQFDGHTDEQLTQIGRTLILVEAELQMPFEPPTPSTTTQGAN